LIAGHGRIMAAQKLGIDDVPCMVAEGWTETQKRAYVIADNKLALNAAWDDELLKVELVELGDLDFDLSLTGFGIDELSELFLGGEEGLGIDSGDGESSGVKGATYLVAGKYKVPMTPEEMSAFANFADKYIDQFGSLQGLVSEVLDA
jgi:hypothetical protein